jgi:serine/threonine protein kinase
VYEAKDIVTDRVGQQIGNYQLVKLLGEGGCAQVYLGKHRYLNSHAALKVLSATIDAEDEPEILAEAQLIMDYAQKGSLRQYYPDGIRMPLTTVVDFVGQIAAGLQYAHNHHVIHCDVKPDLRAINMHSR